MTTYPSIQGNYPAGGSPVGADTRQRGCILGSSFFAMRIGNEAVDQGGLRSYSITTGVEITSALTNTVFGSSSYEVNGPYTSIPTGQLFIEGNASPGIAALVNPATLTMLSSFPVSSLPSLPTRMATPQNYGATSKQGIGYVGCSPDFTFNSEPVVILQAGPTSTQFAGAIVSFIESQAYCCGTPAEVGKIITWGLDLAGPSSADFGLYVTTVGIGASGYNTALWPGTPNSAIATAARIAIPLANIASWATVDGTTPPIYDQFDGHIIVGFTSAAGAVGDKNRFAKIRLSDRKSVV